MNEIARRENRELGNVDINVPQKKPTVDVSGCIFRSREYALIVPYVKKEVFHSYVAQTFDIDESIAVTRGCDE